MVSPDLSQLPPAPPGRRGWPWTVETLPLPARMPGGIPWPRISVVVASLNQAGYVEEMLRSLLLQGYPDLELIFMDGGSTDGTLEIVAKYRAWITHFESAPDRGQSHAFNKGLLKVTGSLFSIFDTDDIFLPAGLATVAQVHAQQPDCIVAGDVIRTWEGNPKNEVHFAREADLRAYAQWWITDHHGQPGIFYPTRFLPEVGPLKEELHFHLDYDLTMRFLEVTRMVPVRAPTALIRVHAKAKSAFQGDYFVWELVDISQRYQRMFPEIDATANTWLARSLFGAGCRRLVRRERDAWRFLRRGFSIRPMAAIAYVFPGLLIRRLRRIVRS